MTSIQIKNVDPELHEALRQRAAADGQTLSEYLLELIRRDLRVQRRRDWLQMAARLPRVELDEDVAELIRADREQRGNQ